MQAMIADAREGSEKLLDGAGISVDRMPMLGVVFDRVASHGTDGIKGLLASPAQLAVREIGVGNIGDILDSFTANVVFGVIHAVEWNTRLLVALDPAFVFTLTEAMFGGDGSEPDEGEDRPPTGIEAGLASTLFEQVAAALQTAFALVAGTPFRFERIEARRDFAFLGKTTGNAVVAELGLTALDREGHMFVVIPQAALNPVRQNFARDVAAITPKLDPHWSEQFAKEVGRAEVTLSAVINSETMTLGDVSTLAVGQFLSLPGGVASPNHVVLECNGRPLFTCELGKADGFYTLRVVADAEQEFINEMMR